MKITQQIRNYVLEEDFKIIYKNGRLYITNYRGVPIFEPNEIHVRYNDGKVVISGKSLTISKLVKDEILITGNISKLEFRLDHE